MKVWITRGWLKRCEDQNDRRGILPLMAVIQANKGKVRPVLDFRELNKHVESLHRNAEEVEAITRAFDAGRLEVCVSAGTGGEESVAVPAS